MKTDTRIFFAAQLIKVLFIATLIGWFGLEAGIALAQSVDTTPDYDCHGETPTITYVGYDFIISGTDGDDVIYVEGGWNFVYANGGNDIVCVEGHFNDVYGGEGDDVVHAQGLYNKLFGNEGDDTLGADVSTNDLNGDGDDQCNGLGC